MRFIYILLIAFAALFITITVTTDRLEASASQAFYVIPPTASGTAGGGTFLGPLANAQRTYQLLIRDSILTGLIGQEITAISWRLLPTAGSNWPPANVTFTNYDIRLSGSVAPENRSLTFSQNIVGEQKLVRSGSLNIDALTYPSGGNPNQFGPEITFDLFAQANLHPPRRSAMLDTRKAP